MPGQRQPHRKMAADRAGAENANSHGVRFPVGGSRTSFHKPAARRNPQFRLARKAVATLLRHQKCRILSSDSLVRELKM
jgi:hypothetical protein